jgi:hypothetical protein
VPEGLMGRSALLSRDGSTAVFISAAALVPEDTDGGKRDIYENTSSGLRLLSSGPEESPVHEDVQLGNMTPDGGHVFFTTKQSLVATDADLEWDLYERFGSTLRVVSVGAVGPTEYWTFGYVGGSEDGSRVYFQSFVDLVPQDTNGGSDIYERTNGQTTLVTAGPSGAVGGGGGTLISADGSRVAFTTAAEIDPADQDEFACNDLDGEFWTCQDIYLRTDSATTWLSTAGCCDDAFAQAATANLSRIFFTMYPADDLYRWENGSLTLISGNAEAPVKISEDGSHVFFRTRAKLVPEDTDFDYDAYESFNGTVRLVSTGPADTGNCCGNVYQNEVLGASADGASVFFETNFRYVAEDDPASGPDVYERTGDQTTLLSKGPSGQGSDLNSIYGGSAISKDGSHVYFHTRKQLTPDDTDDDQDLYVAKIADTAGYPRPKGATPMYLSLVPAAKPCSAPNRTHGPPLVFGSCNPVGPESPNLIAGVGDGNVALSKSVGSVGMRVLAGAPGGPDDSDVELRFSLTNVMNISGLSDYTGELRAQVGVRLTDRASNIPATTQDFPFGFNVQCAATADTTLGGACALTTTADAVVPGSAAEGTRAIWALDKLRVLDGGPDGDADTAGDNSLFATQGVFVP